MRLWIVWLIGLAMAIFTSVLIHKEVEVNKIVRDILVAISVALVGGIAEGWFVATILGTSSSVFEVMFLCTFFSLLSSIFIWAVGGAVLGFYKEGKFQFWEIASFIIVYIIASACWAQPFVNYNSNIEVVNETVVIGEQEYELLSFCNVPVQQVSGSISGDISGSVFHVDGEISGSVSTSEELQYWYVNGSGEGKYNSVPTNNSTIRFIEDGEKSRVKVITYRNQTKTINHNNKKETVSVKGEWNEYVFYLPKEIMQYSLG